jgi:hypothetical protein
MWNHLGPVDVLRINGLHRYRGRILEPSPGAGSAAALVGAMAAAVCAKVARLNDEGGALAQASALSRRLTSLAEHNAAHFESALSELERRDDDVGSAARSTRHWKRRFGLQRPAPTSPRWRRSSVCAGGPTSRQTLGQPQHSPPARLVRPRCSWR